MSDQSRVEIERLGKFTAISIDGHMIVCMNEDTGSVTMDSGDGTSIQQHFGANNE